MQKTNLVKIDQDLRYVSEKEELFWVFNFIAYGHGYINVLLVKTFRRRLYNIDMLVIFLLLVRAGKFRIYQQYFKNHPKAATISDRARTYRTGVLGSCMEFNQP